MRNERHKLRVLSDDPARLLALLRNEGAGQALAAIGKEPTGSFDPFDDLARNDRDADNLRMRMLLRRAGVYAVILEDDCMPYETLTNIFAKELRGREISVNAVAPGPTATDLFLEGKTPEQIAHLAKMPPLERLGRPEDIAGVVSFLVGPGGGWVNGQTLRTNGGIV